MMDFMEQRAREWAARAFAWLLSRKETNGSVLLIAFTVQCFSRGQILIGFMCLVGAWAFNDHARRREADDG